MATCFRKTLLSELQLLASLEKLEAWQQKYPFVDAREETFSNWVVTITPELLSYPPFVAEFSDAERWTIEEFTQTIASLTPDRWDDVCLNARAALNKLSEPP